MFGKSTNSYSSVNQSNNDKSKSSSAPINLRISYSKDPEVKKVQEHLVQVLNQNKNETFNSNRSDIDIQFALLGDKQKKEYQKWLINSVKQNKVTLQKNTNVRLYLNATYINTLVNQTKNNKIKYIDIYAEGANFIALNWDNSQNGRYNFYRDFSMYFAKRQGTECLISFSGCFDNSTNIQTFSNYIQIPQNTDTGFDPIFDDSKIGVGNFMYHTTGLINFGVAGDMICGPIINSYHFPKPPFISCLPPEGWVLVHETSQHDHKDLTNDKQGGNWQDALVGLEAVQFGRDYRNNKFKIEDTGKEIRKRFGPKQHDICKEYIPKIPRSDLYNIPSCNDIPKY